MRQTVSLLGSVLAASGVAAAYRVPAPTNGMRMSSLVQASFKVDTDGTGAGQFFLEHFDRAGNRLGRFNVSGTVAVSTSNIYTFAPTLSPIAISVGSDLSRTGPIPCSMRIEDGDLIQITAVLSAGNATFSEASLAFDVEPV